MKKKKKAAKLSKMSLAARKAWETRRKKYGIKPRGEKKAGAEEAEVVVEQLRRSYRKGRLVRKGAQEHHKSSVKMDEKMWMFLYGSKYIEEVVLRKMYNVAVRAAKEMIFEKDVEVEKPMVLAK